MPDALGARLKELERLVGLGRVVAHGGRDLRGWEPSRDITSTVRALLTVAKAAAVRTFDCDCQGRDVRLDSDTVVHLVMEGCAHDDAVVHALAALADPARQAGEESRSQSDDPTDLTGRKCQACGEAATRWIFYETSESAGFLPMCNQHAGPARQAAGGEVK